MNSNTLTSILTMIIGLIVILLFALVIIYFSSKNRKNKETKVDSSIKENKNKETKVKSYSIESVIDFMEFDKVEDNMIIGKKWI